MTVLFDYVPSRSGYTFLGWARTASAMAAEFTANGTKTFTMGSEDVTLYAVWQESAHTPGSADVWDGTIATEFGGGTGSQSNPYLIYTTKQLAYLAKSTNAGNSYSGKYFKLMNDLDLNNREWTPIGTEARNFYGHFDGNYHTIYNLRITGEMEFAGLFGCTKSGSIARLGVVNGYVNTYYDAEHTAGGLLSGCCNNVDISHCYAIGEVSVKSANTNDQDVCVIAAILVGDMEEDATAQNCYAMGNVYGEMTRNWNVYAGGVFGAGDPADFDNCYFVGNVVAKGYETSYVGGICGVDDPIITDCFVVGTLTAHRGTEGVAVANIAPNNPFGDPSVSNCYCDTSLFVGTTSTTSTQGTSTSRSNFQSQSWITSNLGWDFTSVWTFVVGEEYPVLQGFTQGGGGGNAHVHTPGDWIVDVEPTCTTSGSKHTECTVCGYELENIYIPALEHSYDSVVTKEATCTEPGIVTHTCIRCSDSYLTYIYSEHNYVVTDRQDATCTVDGYITYTCSICDDSYNEIIEGGHNYIAEITRVATATTDGEITYTCEICGDSYVEIIPARPDAKVLLIQDRLPWSENNNVSLLNKMLADGFISGWDMTTTADFSASMLGGYGVVLIANDQTTATYNQLRNIQDALVSFANAGGVVIYGACDEGWAAGSINHTLPAGAQKIHYYSRYNYIVDPSHPIVTGAYTDGKPLTNTLLYGNYCSHTAFGNLPAGSNVILQDGRGNPTLVEYAVGEGHMILSGLTWEFYYVRGAYNGISNTTYTKNVYDDLIMYALQLSDSCDHAYDAGQIVAPTCDEQGYTLHTCALCGTTMKDTFVDATGHTPGDWVVVTQATSTSEGLKTISCTACGEVLDREVIPMLNAPVISVCVEVDSVILGQTFDAYVVVSGSNPVKSVAFVPTFDTELFELVSVQWLKQATIQVTDPEIASAWSTATDINGDLLKLTFRAKGLTAGSRITSEAYIQNNGVVQVSVVGDSIAVVECPHEQFEISGVDGSYHVNVCCVCGYNVLSEHTFDHACDTQCNECDYTRAISHAPGSMMYDNEHHWIACEVCGEHLEVQAHVFDHGCDATCNACGFSRVTGHTPADPEYDNDQHWIACTVCGEYLEVQAHEFDHDCDSDCYFCGYTRTITHAPGGWEMDADCHWQVCGICGETLEYHEHEYDSAIDCVCNICDYRRVLRGDVDGDGDVDSDDSIHLLMHTYFPQNYTLNQEGDMDGDGDLDSDDSIHLLMYTYFPEYYPLYDPDEECL